VIAARRFYWPNSISLSLTGLFLWRLDFSQEPLSSRTIHSYVVINHPNRKEIPAPDLNGHLIVVTGWHVAINAILCRLLAHFIGHPTVPDLVTLQATLREHFTLPSLIDMRIVAGGAGHLRLLKTRTQCEPIELVSGVHPANTTLRI